MPALTARKFFSRVVPIVGGTAISLAALMRSVGWGKVPDANNVPTTVPSQDSFMGDAASAIPLSATLYIGHDQYVRNTGGAGPPLVYQGVATAQNTAFQFQQMYRGVVDAEHIWLYSVGNQNVEIIFAGI